MKNQDLKNAYGPVPTEFHNSVVRTLNTLEEEPVKTTRPRRTWLKVLVACALIAAIGTVGATAAAKLYPMSANKEGNYGLTFDVQTVSSTESDSGSSSIDGMNLGLSADSSAPEYVKLNVGYLPDGVISDGFKYSLNGEHSEKCLTLIVDRVGTTATFSDINIADFEQFEINGNVAILANVVDMGGDNPFGRRFYIYFEDMAAFVTGYITNDYSDEEVRKIMENLTVTEGTEDDCNGGALSDKNSWVNRNDYVEEEPETYTYFDYKDVNLGDEFEYYEGFEEQCNCFFTVDNIEVLDNISGLDSSCFGGLLKNEKLEDFIDENGNLLPYEREYYKFGDGVTAPMYEVVKTDMAERRMVYVTLTVKNTGSQPVEFWFPISMHSKGNVDDTGTYTEDTSYGEKTYIDNNDVDEVGINRGYNKLTLAPNSTETVHIGFWADADMLDYYYICNSVGNAFDSQGNETVTYECIKVKQ